MFPTRTIGTLKRNDDVIRIHMKLTLILQRITPNGQNLLNFPNHVQQLLMERLHNFKTERTNSKAP